MKTFRALRVTIDSVVQFISQFSYSIYSYYFCVVYLARSFYFYLMFLSFAVSNKLYFYLNSSFVIFTISKVFSFTVRGCLAFLECVGPQVGPDLLYT